MLISATLFTGISVKAQESLTLSAPPLVLDAEKPATIFGSKNIITTQNTSWGAVVTALEKQSIAVNVVLNEGSIADARKMGLANCEGRKLGTCDVVAVFTGCLYVAIGIKRVHDTRRRLKYTLAVSPQQAHDDCVSAGYKQCQPPVGGCTQGMGPEDTFALVKKDDP